MNEIQLENRPIRKWYHYAFALPIYFIIVVITLSFTLFFVKSKEYSIELKFIVSLIYYPSITMVIIAHTISMLTNNTFPPSQLYFETCKRCQLTRPLRAHHCKTCGVCMKRMDHHCLWIVNCVGENNQKSFILLLFYGFICSFIGSITLIRPFKYVVINQSQINSTIVVDTILQQIIISSYFTLPIIGFILATIMSFMLAVLMISQIQFLLYNLTLIEWKKYVKKTDSPYYNNNFKLNFLDLFGSDVVWWFIPLNIMNNQPTKEYKPIRNQEEFETVA